MRAGGEATPTGAAKRAGTTLFRGQGVAAGESKTTRRNGNAKRQAEVTAGGSRAPEGVRKSATTAGDGTLPPPRRAAAASPLPSGRGRGAGPQPPAGAPAPAPARP